MEQKCLYCYKLLEEGEKDFHANCSKMIFDVSTTPELPYTSDQINDLAREVVRTQTTLTGVQPKLSLDLKKLSPNKRRFTIGLWGSYILKPQTELYPHLPELEDATMHLAELAAIEVVPHTLIRFQDGVLCYITKRIDRTSSGEKITMEDFCQLSERMTEDKYKSSHERVAKLIKDYSSLPAFDMVKYWEQVIFSWIVGNSDMHLKNYSLYNPKEQGFQLTPAYDLLNTKMVMPEDKEELALTLAGKKSKFKREHFVKAMKSFDIPEKTINKIIEKFIKAEPLWFDFISNSFLPQDMQETLKETIHNNIIKLYPKGDKIN